jgi:hypothetical protein
LNARERVRQALLCRKPDKIPKALGVFDQPLVTIPDPTRKLFQSGTGRISATSGVLSL